MGRVPARIRIPALAGLLAGLAVAAGLVLSTLGALRADRDSEQLGLVRVAAALGPDAAPEDLARAFADFLPATSAKERELQILAAVLECTSRELLPPKFRDLDRGELAARIAALKRELRGG